MNIIIHLWALRLRIPGLAGCCNQVLDPAQTTYDVYSKYVIHDITGQLSEGSNAIGVVLGNGFYGQNVAFHPTALNYGPPLLKALFRLEYEDGTIQEIITDESWKATCGPIVFNNVFAGETYDARYEIPGWNLAGFDDSFWQDAKIGKALTSRLSAQTLPPIRKQQTLKPVDIFLSGNKWIVDFGQNISGWVKIIVSEDPGTVIQIRMAEALTQDGKEINTYSTGHFATGVEQIDVYICNGQEKEEWEPRFTYHGFQFAEISGLTKKPDTNSIEAVWVYSDVEETGTFSSSDPMLNKMHEVSMNTIKGNIHGLPEDCPHREKCGWLGDAHISAEACIYNFDMALFFDKFINDIISTLGRGNPDNRLVPTMVAPGKRLGGNATMDWGVAIVMLPWYMYNYYGDIKPFMNNYAHIKEFISYMMTYINDQGIIENGLGDWCPPLWDRRDNPSAMLCHPYISSTAFLYKTFKIMEFMAIRLNDPAYSEWASKEAEKIKEAFNAQFLVPIDNTPYKWYGSQTATVLAFKYGMVPGETRKNVAEGLKYDIEVTHNGHHTSGIFGLRHIYTVLNDLGYSSLAVHILTVPTFPSQAYIINSGLNTWPERQWEWDSGIEWDRSLNHLMQAGFSAWFHESLAGIQPDPQTPGFKHFVLKPQPPESVDWVKADMRSMYGMISSQWENNNESFQWKINIPANSSATVFIPAGEINISDISGNKIISGQEVTYLRNEDDYLVYKFESGEYVIYSLTVN